jgi:hypothetical protein
LQQAYDDLAARGFVPSVSALRLGPTDVVGDDGDLRNFVVALRSGKFFFFKATEVFPVSARENTLAALRWVDGEENPKLLYLNLSQVDALVEVDDDNIIDWMDDDGDE